MCNMYIHTYTHAEPESSGLSASWPAARGLRRCHGRSLECIRADSRPKLGLLLKLRVSDLASFGIYLSVQM